jgi:mannosyltransferase
MQTTALNLNTAPAADTHTRSRVRVALWLSLMMVFIMGMSALFFSTQSLRLDEAQSLWQSGRSAGDILTLIAQDVHVPLYHELLHFWRLMVGDSVGAARFLSLLFYLALVPAMYLLGKLAYGQRAGLFAAALVTISPFLNWYGNEIRMYTLFTLLVVLNQYCFIKLWRAEDQDSRDHAWVGYIVTSLLGIFTHYFFFMTLAAQAAFYLARRELFPKDTLKRFLFSWGFLAVAFAPWVFFVLSQGQAQNASPVLAVPTTVNLFSAFAEFLFGFQDNHLNTVFLSLWPLSLVLGFLALRKSSRIRPETEYFMISLILSVGIAFFGSFLVAPLFVSRYLIFTIPSLYLLIASLISLYPPRAATLARYGLMGLMLAMLTLEILNPATPVKENYREASTYLTDRAAAQDVVVLSAPFTVYPIEYYYRGVAPLSTLPAWDRYAYGAIPAFDEGKLPSEVETLSKSYQYAYVLFSYDQGYEATIKSYFDNHFEKVDEKTFSPGLTLYVYKLRYDTPLAQLPRSASATE